MAKLLQISRVLYQIHDASDDCDSLANLYFCMYCLSLRSADVLQHEVSETTCFWIWSKVVLSVLTYMLPSYLIKRFELVNILLQNTRCLDTRNLWNYI